MIEIDSCGGDNVPGGLKKLIKRQRKPSQYASSIQNFKQQYERYGRKQRVAFSNSEQTNTDHNQSSAVKCNPCKCVLPSGRKLNLSIVIKKSNPKRVRKQISNRGGQERDAEVCYNDTAVNSPPAFDLLEKFLLAAEELNKLEQEDKEKNDSGGQKLLQQREEGARKEARGRGERDEGQKVMRFCQKSKILSQKLQNLIVDMVYL